MALERKILFAPAYNLIRAEPSENFGVHNMVITFVVIGEKGAIQWQISTGWHVESAREHLDRLPRGRHEVTDRKPWGTDLGYHARAPLNDWQREHGPAFDNCDILEGPCYYDGSSLNAEKLEEGFLAGGTDWLWPKLEAVYACYFEGGEWPDFAPVYRPHPNEVAA